MIRTLVMVKAPVPGLVKTRLLLAPEQAAKFQEALIKDTVAKARALGEVTVAGTPTGDLNLIEPLIPKEAQLIAQSGGDLGERMFAAAFRLFEEGPEPLLVLGTDVPTLLPDSIRRAVRALEGKSACDASIVGSTDGGYVLLGLKELYKPLFRGISWSTDAVYRETLEKARRLDLSLYEGEPHYDVDTPEDLVRLRAELAARPDCAPRTAELLESLKIVRWDSGHHSNCGGNGLSTYASNRQVRPSGWTFDRANLRSYVLHLGPRQARRKDRTGRGDCGRRGGGDA